MDIQPIATQISKLRFFISLVVDQNPTKDPKTNFGIRPLPNLESKFVTANTLIPLDRSRSLFTSTDDTRFYEEMLHELNHRIFLAKRDKDKQDLQTQMINVRRMMAQTLENLHIIGGDGYTQLTEWDMFDQNASASFFDPEWMFGVKEGFDVVIGNPPYIDYRKIDDYTKSHLDNYRSYSICRTASIFVYFIELSLRLLNKKGSLVFINPYQYLSADSGKGIRSVIMPNKSLKKLVDVSHIKVFENADTYTCINIFDNYDDIDEICIFKPIDLACIENNRYLIKWESVNKVDEYKIVLSQNPIIQKIDTTIKSKLEDFARILCGLSAAGFRDCVSMSKINKDYLPFTESKEIKRYITQPYKYISKHIFGEKALSSFSTSNIFMARMTSHIRAAISSPYESAGKVNVIYNMNEIDKYYILGLLNSKLLDYYYCIKNESKHMNGGAFGFDTPSVKSLPIPKIDMKIKHKIVEMVKSIIAKSYACESTSSLEEKLDFIIYSIYGLDYDEVLIVDPEAAITRDEFENFKVD